MHAFGTDYGFRFSVGAAMEIAKKCPDGKIENLTQILNGGTAESLDVLCTLAEQASLAYEQAKAFESGESVGRHLTKEMALALDFAQLAKLNEEVTKALGADGTTTVEVEKSKKKRAANAHEQSA